MEAGFIRRFSPETKHFRFLGGVSELTLRELTRCAKSMATTPWRSLRRSAAPDQEMEIGVSRYAENAKAECSRNRGRRGG